MIEVKLKQHTPLIHFQRDQSGVGLRASEVKPRLDRYLRQVLQEVDRKWVVNFGRNTQQEALNYRMSIHSKRWNKLTSIEKEHPRNDRLEQFPGFFANMGEKDRSKHKQFVYSKDPILLRIHTIHADLEAVLIEHLPRFFARNNFMTRKTKGFGSFTVSHINGEPKDIPRPLRYTMELSLGEERDAWKMFNKLFERIDIFYRTLRSGINLKGRGGTSQLYFKSLLFQYAKEHKHQWDKRKMRRDLFLNDRKFQEVERTRTDKEGTVQYNKGEPFLYRDMLGLASLTKWMSYGNAEVSKKPVGKAIERYPSPVTFKPIDLGDGDFDVFILTEGGNKVADMTGTTFEMKTGSQTSRIATPPEFDIDRYLAFAFGYFRQHDFLDYVGQYDRKAQWLVYFLQDTYNELAEQL